MTSIEKSFIRFKIRMNTAYNYLRDTTVLGIIIFLFTFAEMGPKVLKGRFNTLIGLAGIAIALIALPLFLASITVFAALIGAYATLDCLFLPLQMLAIEISEQLFPPNDLNISQPEYIELDEDDILVNWLSTTQPEKTFEPILQEPSLESSIEERVNDNFRLVN